MKKRRIISFIVSMAMLVSSMAALHVTAEDAETAKQTILPADWHFMDIAHNGDTVVAMAKSATNATGRLYYSADGGNNWQAAENQPLAEAAEISANKVSQQQLVYWDANNIFVAHGAKSTYKSEDGISWTEGDKTTDNKMPLHWSTNTMLTVSGPHLVFGGQGSANATSSLTTWEFANNKYTTNASVLSQVVVAQPADADGNVKVLLGGQGYLFDVSFKATSPKYTWEKLENNAGGTVPTAPYDGIYSSKANQYFLIDGTNTMMVANGEKGSKNFKKLSVYDEKIVGIGMNDEYIVVGTDANKLYKTNNVTITEETIWTEIPVMEGMTPADEPIKNIEFLDDGSFIALGTTQIYKGSVEGGYKNINEAVEAPTATPTATPTAPTATPTVTPEPTDIPDPDATPGPTGTPKPAGEGPFGGVQLIGGAYNDSTYVVYGNVKNAPDEANQKMLGRIFTSTDGINWDVTDGVNTFTEQKNGAVWWEAKNKFVISAVSDKFPQSSDGTVGYALVSSDGSKDSWELIKTTDFRMDTDIAVNGDKLYTTNFGRQFRIFTGFDSQSEMTNIPVTPSGGPSYMNTLAISNVTDADGIPAALMAEGAKGVVRNHQSTEADEANKWKVVNIGNDTMTDAIYSESLGKFIVMLKGAFRTSIVSLDGTATVQGPVVTGGKVCSAIDSNGTDFMLACADGGVYTAPDDENFYVSPTEKATLAKVPAEKDKENTMPLVNVFKAGEKFIALASDGYDSDALIISKSGDSYSYVSVIEALKPDSTPEPTQEPTATPTTKPTDEPTTPTVTPTTKPTDEPTTPTAAPTTKPTDEPKPGDYSIECDEMCRATVNAPNGTYAIVFAAYDGEGKLISVAFETKEISKPNTVVVPMSFSTAGAVSGKVMLWNSIESMVPHASNIIPFG